MVGASVMSNAVAGLPRIRLLVWKPTVWLALVSVNCTANAAAPVTRAKKPTVCTAVLRCHAVLFRLQRVAPRVVSP